MARRFRHLSLFALPFLAAPAIAAEPAVKPRAEITSAGAHALIDAALAEAAKAHLTLSLAVVDLGGNLVSFHRMDGSPVGMIAVAQAKARSAAIYRMPTRDIGELVKRVGLPMLTSPDMIALGGGMPITVDGAIVGAIGVTGGTGEQDLAVAQAAIAAAIH